MSEEPKNSLPRDSEREARLESLIAEFIRATEAGLAPRCEDLLKQHPEFAAELKPFFAQRDRMKRMVDPIREFGDDLYQSIGPGKHLSYVGNYELLEEVARGGMGVVYKARQTTLGRIVAVKMIVAGRLANEQDVQRFQSEAQAAASLKHPNIVSIHEVGQHEGWHYFSMDFIEGHDLATVLRLNLLPAKTAATYVSQMAEAIHYAHQQGILHRDLKPSNILIDQQNQIHITDFGLAMRVEADQGLTQTGQILGTPSYMPPEQAQGKRGLIEPGSDVYALGAILYECLTGRPPFRAESVIKTIEQVIHAEAASPRTLNAAIPRDLETICLKCLEKEPHRRYGTAQLLADDLGRYLDDRPILARPVSTIERTWRWCRRNPAIASLLATVALCLIVGIIGTSWGLVREAKLRKIAETNEDKANDAAKQERVSKLKANDAAEQARIAKEKAVAAENDERKQRQRADQNAERSRSHLYVAHMNLAISAWDMGRVSRTIELLDLWRHSVRGESDLRGFEYFYLDRLCHREQYTLRGHTSDVFGVAFSPHGTRLASAGREGNVKLWNALTGEETHTLKGHTRAVLSVAFSPDGRRLASASMDQTVKVWNTATGQESLTLKGHTDQVTSVAFSPNGTHLASASRDQTVKLWDADTGKETRLLKGHTAGVAAIAFNPDGTYVATASMDRTVKLWDADTGKDTLVFKGHSDAVFGVAFSPDGKHLASASSDRTVKLWDVATGEETLTLKGHTGSVMSVAFSPDCKHLASASSDRTVKLWDASTGEETLTLKGHNAGVLSVAFSLDGTRMASAGYDQTVKVWDTATRPETLALKGRTETITSVAFSPDSACLATASIDGTVKVWNATTGQAKFTLQGQNEGVDRVFPVPVPFPGDSTVVFSPDGTRLASGSRDHTVKLWATATGEEMFTLKGHSGAVLSVAFSPDSKYLATAGTGRDRTIKLWNMETGQQTLELERFGNLSYAPHLAFSRDGKYLASVGSGVIGLWNLATGDDEVRKVGGPLGTSLAFSPDGKYLASVCGNRIGELLNVKLRDAPTGMERLSLVGHTGVVRMVAFSPDSTRLATGSDNGTVKLWDAMTGLETVTLKEQTDLVFSPDGKRLATASNDRTAGNRILKLWDTATGLETLSLKGRTMVFSPDGTSLATAMDDGTVRIFDGTPLAEMPSRDGLAKEQ